MDSAGGSGPPPPPHGDNPKSSYGSASDLPAGNYDIFVIPPHSAGSGFIYLPSLQPQINSFVAGVVCTLGLLYLWKLVEPIIRSWFNAINQSGGAGGILVLSLVVGFAGWIYGQTSTHGFKFPGTDGGPSANGSPRRAGTSSPPPPNTGETPGKGRPGAQPNGNATGGANGAHSSGARPNGGFAGGQQHGSQQHNQQSHQQQQNQSKSSSSAWEKAREETRRREEERKKADDARRLSEEAERRRAEAERQAKAAAEKEKWEQMRAREKEQREREEREKQARERMAANSATKQATEQATKAKEAAERDARLKAAQERAEKIRSERAASEKANTERAKSERATPVYGVGERTSLYGTPPPAKSTIGLSSTPKPPPSATETSPRKPYHHPTAQSYTGTQTDHAFRPYDAPPKPKHHGSAGSFYSSAYSDASESTAPSSFDHSPYSTDDENKVVIRAAFKFTDSFPKPVAVVRPGESGITDGLVMRMDTAGVFLDDDRKREPLRTWDIKTWTMNRIEVCLGVYWYRISLTCVKVHAISGFPYHSRFDQGCREYEIRIPHP